MSTQLKKRKAKHIQGGIIERFSAFCKDQMRGTIAEGPKEFSLSNERVWDTEGWEGFVP